MAMWCLTPSFRNCKVLRRCAFQLQTAITPAVQAIASEHEYAPQYRDPALDYTAEEYLVCLPPGRQ